MDKRGSLVNKTFCFGAIIQADEQSCERGNALLFREDCMKDDPRPWRFLDEYRGTEFTGTWPTLKQMFHISVLRYPDRRCWSCFGKNPISLSYSEAERTVLRVSEYLLSLGVGKDTHIAVSGKNSPQWAIAFMAVIYAGAVVVPLDCTLKENEIENLVRFGDVDYFFGDVDRIRHAAAHVKQVFSLEVNDSYPYILDLGTNVGTFEAPTAGEDDLAAILFTSGTTGTPKGVMLTHKNLVSCCYQAQANMNIYSTDVFYAILPIHHAYTLQADFIEAMSVGAHLVFGKHLVVSQILGDMKEGGVTMFLAVPMLFNKMIQALMAGVRKKGLIVYGIIRGLMLISGILRDYCNVNIGKRLFKGLLAKLSLADNRICICGGGPLPMSTIRMYHQLGLDFVQGYGMTETSPITHLNPIYAFIKESVGKNCAGIEQKIVSPDEDGNGVLYLRGSAVMKGYYKNPEATAEVLSPDGWLNTGDVGHLDVNGYLYLTGRQKNIIVSEGGKNIFPEEIEDMFQLYGEIAQLCIIPYREDREKKSEKVRILLLPEKGFREKNTSEEIEKRMNEIVDEVNRNLQPYKRITKVTVIDEPLPETSTRKVKRGEVLKLYQDR